MGQDMPLSESMEDYLETIYILEQAQRVARAKEIAERMGVGKGSVTGALKSLEAKGLINYAPYRHITLTPEGNRLAREIVHRHAVLKDFLTEVLRLEPDVAETTACRMEHAVDEAVLDRLVCFLQFTRRCPRARDDWIQSFVHYCTSGELDVDRCGECLDTARNRNANGDSDKKSGCRRNTP